MLGPTIAELSGSWGAEFLSLYFPTSDLFLVAVSAFLMFSPLSTRYLQPVFLLLCSGLIILAVTDSLLGYFSLSPSGFNTGTLQDILWPLSMMFIGLAAIEYRRSIACEKSLAKESRNPTLLEVPTRGRLKQIEITVRTIIPFLLALLTSIVLLIAVHSRGGAVLLQADLVALALVVVVVIRQALTLIENTQLTMQIHGELVVSQSELLTKRQQALTDALTSLPNHRAVVDVLTGELERTRRSQHSLSLLFFDADRFKQVNDTYGHAAGDAVLRQIGERVGSVLREVDTLGRFGGEEFVVLLPEANVNEANIVAERIRAAVAASPLATTQIDGGILTTVSIGIATYPTDADTEQGLLQQADEAMYLAKRLGRNQVRTALEARQAGVDVELITLLQKEEQYEATQREGVTAERLRETYTVKMICSLLTLLERRDESLSAHAHAVSDLATAIVQRMQQDPKEVSKIGRAALLHDIGKVALPDQLLQKSGPLSSQERAWRWEHAELGAQILEASPFLIDLMPMVRSHHERWDGHGYPDKLAGEEIPLSAMKMNGE